MSKEIVGILFYESTGHNKSCGQTIGSNGSGSFCVVYYGDAEKANNDANELLNNLIKNGYGITHSAYVENNSLASYNGSPVSFKNVD